MYWLHHHWVTSDNLMRCVSLTKLHFTVARRQKKCSMWVVKKKFHSLKRTSCKRKVVRCEQKLTACQTRETQLEEATRSHWLQTTSVKQDHCVARLCSCDTMNVDNRGHDRPTQLYTVHHVIVPSGCRVVVSSLAFYWHSKLELKKQVEVCGCGQMW